MLLKLCLGVFLLGSLVGYLWSRWEQEQILHNRIINGVLSIVQLKPGMFASTAFASRMFLTDPTQATLPFVALAAWTAGGRFLNG